MLLTETQLHEIREIIRTHHEAFVVNTIGHDAVAPAILEKLKAQGLVNVKITSMEDAYLYGQLVAMMQDPKTTTMSYEQFKEHIRKNPVPLSAVEKQAVQMAKMQAAQMVVGLGNKIDTTTGQLLIEADAKLRAQMQAEIQTQTAENIAKRESVKKLKSELGWATGDWARDWDRIAITEKHNAMQRGVADHYRKRYGDDALVAKRPMPDACKHCKRLHLGPDGQPRIFKLSDLEANGTNFGRKAADWLPTVGAVHPHCQCQMVRIPAGWGFNEDGDLVPGGPLGQHYADEADLALAMLQENDLYKAFKLQDHIEFQGIPIAIENKAGTKREWTASDGTKGETVMEFAYGYVKRTNGMDEDEIDVFIGPNPRASMVYVVEQQNPDNGLYDEQKCMLGFSSKAEAQAAYQSHYNRPDFYVTCQETPIDSFKRWVGSTPARTGEMMKKSGPALVIPLQKATLKTVSGKVDENWGSQHSPAGNRNVTGFGMNYAVETPARDVPNAQDYGFEMDPRRFKADVDHNMKTKHQGGKEKYTFLEPVPRKVTPFVLPENYGGQEQLGDGQAEERREAATKRPKFTPPHVVRNPVEPEETDADGRPKKKQRSKFTLKKASATAVPKKGSTPIGGITPGGYYKKAVDNYVPVSSMYSKNMSALQAAVKKMTGASLKPHKTDGWSIVLKMPTSKKATLETLAKVAGVKVDDGPNKSRITLNEAQAKKIEDHLKTLAKKQAPKAAAPQKQHDIAPTVPVQATSLERLGEVEFVNAEDLDTPHVPPGNVRAGSGVRVVVKGKARTLRAVGFDNKGRPVVRDPKSGKTWVAKNWHKVEHVAGDPKPAIAKMKGEGTLVKASSKQQALMTAVMEEKIFANVSGKDVAEYMHKDGHEAYAVGGLVRDMLAGEVKGLSDDAIKETMKDVDLVVSAPPGTMKYVVDQLTDGKAQQYLNQGNDNSVWGVQTYGDPGVGLDLASMVGEGGHEGFQTHYGTDGESLGNDSTTGNYYDHDLDADVDRRDFTCNALYYDIHNHVIIDPTGHGYADAQHKVLRFAPKGSADAENNLTKNAGLIWRWWKMRSLRGYAAEAESLKKVRKLAAQQIPKQAKEKDYKGQPRIAKAIGKMVGKNGGNARKSLDAIRDTMIADGVGDLYKTWIKPLEGKILEIAKHNGAN